MSDTRQAWFFALSTLLVSWGFEALIIAKGGAGVLGLPWLVALMCIPGAMSVLARLVFRAGFADAGFRLGAFRYYAYALALPLMLALLTGLVASLLDIRHYSVALPDAWTGAAAMASIVLGLGVLGAVGEEIGWRGFLLPKLVAGGARHPYLATGLVWAAWHLPLIAFGGFYRTDDPLRMALVYGVGIVAINFLVCELRMRSGSVWVASAIHAAHNFFFQFAVPVLLLTSPGANAAAWDLLAGDTGLSVAALYALAYLVFARANRPVEPRHSR